MSRGHQMGASGRHRQLCALLVLTLAPLALVAQQARAQEASAAVEGPSQQQQASNTITTTTTSSTTTALNEPQFHQQQEPIPSVEQLQQPQVGAQQRPEQSQQQVDTNEQQQQQQQQTSQNANEQQTTPRQPTAAEAKQAAGSSWSENDAQTTGAAGQPQQLTATTLAGSGGGNQEAFAEAPQGIIMRENVVEQEQAFGNQQEQQQQQPPPAVQVASGERFATRLPKAGRASKRLFGDHAGEFGRKRSHRPQAPPSHRPADQTGQTKNNQRKSTTTHHHFYYQTVSPQRSAPVRPQQQISPNRGGGGGGAAKGGQPKLRAADFAEDYREILVQPDNLSAGQEYEVQRQQQQQSDTNDQQSNKQADELQQQQRQQQEGRQIDEQQQERLTGEPELANADEAARVNNNADPQQQELNQQPISQPNEQQVDSQQQQQQQQQQRSPQAEQQAQVIDQGFEHADDTSTSAPYIRLSNIATINSTTTSSNGTGQGQSLSSLANGVGGSGGEMKLMRIYVIDLDQKLVVGSGGAQESATSQAPGATGTATTTTATISETTTPAEQAPIEQTKISADSSEEQQQQTVTVYATTSLPQTTMPAELEGPDSSSAGLSGGASQQQQQQQQAHGNASHQVVSPADEQQHRAQVVLPRVVTQVASKLNEDYVLVDRDSLHANLSQIMAQMGHYSAPSFVSLPGPFGSPFYAANHRAQNLSQTTTAGAHSHYSPSSSVQQPQQLQLQGQNQAQLPAQPQPQPQPQPVAYYNHQPPTGHYSNFSSYEMVQLANKTQQPFVLFNTNNSNVRNQYLAQSDGWSSGPAKEHLQAAGAAKSARAADSADSTADYKAQHKNSVAYPSFMVQAQNNHNNQHLYQQQQHAQFAAVYPSAQAAGVSVPQFIAPQYARPASANSTHPGAGAAPAWPTPSVSSYVKQQLAYLPQLETSANYSEQFATEWPSAGYNTNSDTNYTPVTAANSTFSGPTLVVQAGEQQSSSSPARQLDKYQRQQPQHQTHLFAYVQQQTQQPAEQANLMYQQHPIGNYAAPASSSSGEPGQQSQAIQANYQQAEAQTQASFPYGAGAKVSSVPLDGHWRPVDLTSPFNSYGPAGLLQHQQQPQQLEAQAQAQQQNSAPSVQAQRALNGYSMQPDHDIVSLSANQAQHSAQLQQPHTNQSLSLFLLANGTGTATDSATLTAPAYQQQQQQQQQPTHLIATDGEHAQLNYYSAQSQSQASARAKPANQKQLPNNAYANTPPEQPSANYENGSLGQALVGGAELAPSQQVHHPSSASSSSSSASSLAPYFVQHNGTADYQQQAGSPPSASPFGVTNEYGQQQQQQQQVAYTTTKRHPANVRPSASVSSAASDQSSSSEEAPRIPQLYSSVPAPAPMPQASQTGGNNRRPSYAIQTNLSDASSIVYGGQQQLSADESESDTDEAYESDAPEPAAQNLGHKSARPAGAKRHPSGGRPKTRPGGTRSMASKAPYGESEAAIYSGGQQHQADTAAGGGVGEQQALVEAGVYQTRAPPQGIRQYLSSMAEGANQQYAQALRETSGSLAGRPGGMTRPANQLAANAYYRPMSASSVGKSLLSWETISSVASGAAKRIPSALSSFLSPFGMGANKSPMYPTAQSAGYAFHHQALGQHPKSAHFSGDVANFHRPYPFRYMSPPESYSDSPTNQGQHAHLQSHSSPPQHQHLGQQHGLVADAQSAPDEQQADDWTEESDDLSSSSSSDSNTSSHAHDSTAPQASANATAPGESLPSSELTGDTAELRPDLKSAQNSAKSRRPSASPKTKGKRPTKPVISGEPAGGAASNKPQHLEPAQAAVLTSIEQQLEQQQPPQLTAAHQPEPKPVKPRRRAKKVRPSSSQAHEPTAPSFIDGALLAEQPGGAPGQPHQQPIQIESMQLDQQRLLLAGAKGNPLLGLSKAAASQLQVPLSSAGVMFAADGSAILGASGAPSLMGPQLGATSQPAPLRPGGMSSVQIGQYKITPQTQFVHNIIEPSRQMLGQYFKQYIGQLGQLG